jgi:hypothetical protein
MIYQANTSEEIVAYFNDNEDCEATDTFNINVSFPIPEIFIEGQVLLCDLSGYDYQWFLEDEIIQGANAQYYIPELTGIYTVMLSNDLGCEELSTPFQFSTVIINEFDKDFESSIYPNPSNDIFEIYINSTTTQNISIEVYNPIGKIIHSFSDTQVNTYKKTYNFSVYASGLYHVVIKAKNTEKHHKLILN